ncbi:hypothetical protein E2C01_001574 [Portunus trituberculatus]|uniref:Secreted protein n=1 Tax=Portunus trituberculatus TaxID=210409 RepID=A0A5B7CI56_PORTR|nr:hypothetical protein [Portunus trituberculatus]
MEAMSHNSWLVVVVVVVATTWPVHSLQLNELRHQPNAPICGDMTYPSPQQAAYSQQARLPQALQGLPVSLRPIVDVDKTRGRKEVIAS